MLLALLVLFLLYAIPIDRVCWVLSMGVSSTGKNKKPVHALFVILNLLKCNFKNSSKTYIGDV